MRADRDGRRVRRRDPGRAVRADRRRRRSASGIVETLHGPPLAGRADAQPRRRSPSAPTREAAVKAAVMCEDVARTVHLARAARRAAADRAGRHRRAVRPLPERLRTAAEEPSDTSDARGLVPDRQPGAVRRGDARARWPSSPSGSPRRWTTSPDIAGRVVWKPVLTDAAAIRRVLPGGQRRRTRASGVIAWMHTFSPGQDVDRRAGRAAQAAAAPAHPGQRGAAVERHRHGLHEPQPGRARRPRVRLHPDPARRGRARPSPGTSATRGWPRGSARGPGPRRAGRRCARCGWPASATTCATSP